MPVEYEISAGVWHDRCVRLESELLAFGSLEVVCVVGARIGRIQFERKSVGADVVRMAGYDRLLTKANISRVVKTSPAPRRVIVGAWRPVRPTNEQKVFGVIVETPTKLVFLTTGKFSKGATDYAELAHTRVILIDGHRLTEQMIRYGVRVQSRRVLNVVAVDEDFFE